MEVDSPLGVSPVDLHPDAAEIIRQVEYYFSDDNLPGDAHLLAKTGGDGNGPVSLNHILGFKKMRGFKPKRAVIQALKRSTNLIILNDKFIQRAHPLLVPLRVAPENLSLAETTATKTLAEKPWLSKRLLQPTGLEEYANDGPITPAEYQRERALYDPEEAIYVRLESAVARYLSRRKMHQLAQQVFTKFLLFGGWSQPPRQFTGGFDARALADSEFTADEIAQMKCAFQISDSVLDSLKADSDTPITRWRVDFEIHAKAFLASPFLDKFDWKDPHTVNLATLVLKNFYNYLLYHDVCNEHAAGIKAAIRVCDVAAQELPRLAAVDEALPGDFNIACSKLFGGHCARSQHTTFSPPDWGVEGESVPPRYTLSANDAMSIVATALIAHGLDTSGAMLGVLDSRRENSKPWPHPYETLTYETGLEVISTSPPEKQSLYTHPRLHGTIIRPTGKLICKPWIDGPQSHTRAPLDAPPDYCPPTLPLDTPFTILAEPDLLAACYPGVRLEGTIMRLTPSPSPSATNSGPSTPIYWIDSVTYVYPSFFIWTANELVDALRHLQKPMGGSHRGNVNDVLPDPARDESDKSGADGAGEAAVDITPRDDSRSAPAAGAEL